MNYTLEENYVYAALGPPERALQPFLRLSAVLLSWQYGCAYRWAFETSYLDKYRYCGRRQAQGGPLQAPRRLIAG